MESQNTGTIYGMMDFQPGFMVISFCFMGILSNLYRKIKMYVLNKN